MKKRTSAFVFALSAIMAGTLMTSCGSKPVYDYQYNIDGPNKVKIVTANFGGGIGNEWLYKAIDRFAQKMNDYEFEDGKKGVYIDASFASFELGTGQGMENLNRHVFFDERMSDVQDLANQKLLLNLDSIVKEDTARIGGTIESNLFPSIKDGLQVKLAEGSETEQTATSHYYGLPHYEYYGGLTYNREVFESIGAFITEDCDLSMEYEASFTKNNPASGEHLIGHVAGDFFGEPDCKLTCGPDGKTGVIDGYDYSLDDGLPRTLDEFVLLMDFIKFRNYYPIALSGQYSRYMDYLVSGLWASFAGEEQMRNYYNCTGKIEVVELNNDGSVKTTDENLITGIDYIKKPVTKIIDMDDPQGSLGYHGNEMAAKYYALSLLDVIYNGQYLTQHATVGTNSHYDAQGDLFLGKYSDGYQKAAMLIEGTYWYNETEEFAKNLTKYERYSGKSAKDLDLRWMSLPVSTVKSNELAVDSTKFVGKEQCLLDIGHSYTMVNRNVEQSPSLKKAVLEFVKFLYTEEELANFTIQTGMSRMINYQVPEEKMDQFEPFYRKLYLQRQHNTNNVIGLSGTSDCFLLNKNALKIELQSEPLKEAAATPRTLYGILSATGENNHTAKIFKMYLKTNVSTWKVPTK